MVELCSPDFGKFIMGTLVPLSFYAAIATAGLMAFVFMIARMISNPRLLVWVETEILQLGISCFSVAMIVLVVNSFCGLDFSSLGSVFGIPNIPKANLYQAAAMYLNESAIYSHNAMTVVRYHLEAYTVLSYFNAFNCDFTVAGSAFGFGCFFGYGGENLQPFGGYGAYMAALNIFFNSTVISYFTAMNSIMILLFTYKGFAFFFLPLGIFLRSMPYLRPFGSLLISISLAFLIVYPLILSILYLTGDVTVERVNGYFAKVPGPDLKDFYNEAEISSKSGAGQSLQALGGKDVVFKSYFPNGDNPIGAMIFAGYAFIAATFLPTVALLGTLASVAYIAHLYGDEIDLSRVVQLV
ncbi:hypothetical protein HY988_06900 [Candidatus Micrarchaeota archaeon]|nr:hypothetical protein [Candidatus Micrarchaeota archaeon]